MHAAWPTPVDQKVQIMLHLAVHAWWVSCCIIPDLKVMQSNEQIIHCVLQPSFETPPFQGNSTL